PARHAARDRGGRRGPRPALAHPDRIDPDRAHDGRWRGLSRQRHNRGTGASWLTSPGARPTLAGTLACPLREESMNDPIDPSTPDPAPIPPPPAAAPPPPSGAPSNEERQWALFTHLSALAGFIIPFGNLLGPLVMWQVK